jgi:hypothetical protein
MPRRAENRSCSTEGSSDPWSTGIYPTVCLFTTRSPPAIVKEMLEPGVDESRREEETVINHVVLQLTIRCGEERNQGCRLNKRTLIAVSLTFVPLSSPFQWPGVYPDIPGSAQNSESEPRSSEMQRLGQKRRAPVTQMRKNLFLRISCTLFPIQPLCLRPTHHRQPKHR